MEIGDDHISSADKTYRPSYTGADKVLRSNILLDSDLKDTIDTWNRKNRRLGSCLGQNLYFLLVFSQRIPYAVYSLC